jgi:nucleotide-binding universal stress UspA family protein
MGKIIVGVDRSHGSRDAVALASGLAGLTGSTLVLANVFPYDETPSRALNHEFEAYLRDDAKSILELLRVAIDAAIPVETRVIPNPSAPHGLHALAEEEDAGLIVVGSTHTGRLGRVLPGSTAERLLHGSPCPVAVAPKGYADRPAREPQGVGCGFDGSQSSQAALAAARRLAEATGSQLRLIRAFEPLAYDVAPGGVALGGGTSYNLVLQERAAEELDMAAAGIEGAEGNFEVGDPVRLLADCSEFLDLLFVGSRGYGPLHSVIVGGVAGRLVREAACPVIVFPRGAAHAATDSVFAETTSLPS